MAKAGELGEAPGSMLAVEAGQTPQGTNYIWTLVRPEAGAGQEGDADTVYATDGACRSCSFPLSKSKFTSDADGPAGPRSSPARGLRRSRYLAV